MTEVYQVICPQCGTQPLTEDDYTVQMYQPDERWKCPKCLGVAEFDDAAWEASLDEEEEFDEEDNEDVEH